MEFAFLNSCTHMAQVLKIAVVMNKCVVIINTKPFARSCRVSQTVCVLYCHV